MTITSFQISSLLGIWLIGPILIIVVSLSILTMCFCRIRTKSVKPELLLIDTKSLFFHHNQFSGKRMGCNCSNHLESNKCSKLWIKPLKSFHKKSWQIPEKLCKELSLLQNMHHTNINPLIGAMIENHELFLLTPYCNKGSLQDILSDMRTTFRKPVIISLIQDLICGLAYIHHSSIKCHGRLKSSNCLINSGVRLKIADFGINRLRELTPMRESSPPLVDRLWLAPEQLRNQNYCLSWQADIYSFSIILHEIVHRQGPFNIHSAPAVDVSFILDKIEQKPSSDSIAELFRPKIMDNPDLELGCPFYIRHCLEDCWRESPNMRPNANEIFCRLLIMKNETYPSIVSTQSDEIALLQQEKEIKSRLLSSIIPSHAATELVKGLRVKPQVFESATLLFTNIANFREISESSSPHEQVNLLNDLYRIFDSIVQEYQVYKVETVKDTYFVASGLFPSDVHHLSEAALLALDLLNSLQNYRAPHSPHLAVLLRLGMHIGPVAAGVIGLDKPRFCLFGDTVNTTSRLSTTGEPSHIHISSECHLALGRKGGFITRERGLVYLKGKGMRKTYWLIGTDQS